jgi:hypothetical protein
MTDIKNIDLNLANEFNLKKVSEFTGNDHSVIKDLLYLMIESFTEDFHSLQSYTSPLKTNLIKSLAHKIKPNFDLIGLDSLFEISNILENKSLSNEEYYQLTKAIYGSKTTIIKMLSESIEKLNFQTL